MAFSFIIWLVLALLIAFAVFYLLCKPKNKKPDYYTLFVIGITWVIIGIPLKMYPLFIVGLVLTFVGLLHRKEWKKQKCDFKDKKLLWFFLLGLIIFLIAAVAVYWYTVS